MENSNGMDDSRFFIVGANGQLGTALRLQYPNAKFADIDELDITNRDSVMSYDWSNVTHILNAAAYTNVDGAETQEGRVTAWKVNATAVGYLVEVAAQHDLTLVHVSTDYVFDGTLDLHTEYEDFSPLSVYGASKAAADLMVSKLYRHYILRTSWVIGEGENFVRTMLDVGKRDISPTVVSDQIGRLTFTSELVRALDHLLQTTSSKPSLGVPATYGTYNVSNSGEPASWADITRKIYAYAGFSELQVHDIATADYYADKKGIAPRPLKSVLDLSKLTATGFVSRNWYDDLRDYLADEFNGPHIGLVDEESDK